MMICSHIKQVIKNGHEYEPMLHTQKAHSSFGQCSLPFLKTVSMSFASVILGMVENLILNMKNS